MSGEPQDTELMLQAQRGDHAAFAELYHRYERPIFNFFYRLCFSRTLAEEYLQEVFLRLWRHAPRYHPTAKFTTYLFQIAKNFWLNERIKLARDRKQLSLGRPIDGADGPPLSDFVAHAGETPSETAVRQELTETLNRAIEALDEKHRLVFVLSEFHGFKYREIAQVLEIPEGTVKTRMYHAARRLRDLLPDLALEMTTNDSPPHA